SAAPITDGLAAAGSARPSANATRQQRRITCGIPHRDILTPPPAQATCAGTMLACDVAARASRSPRRPAPQGQGQAALLLLCHHRAPPHVLAPRSQMPTAATGWAPMWV